MLLWGQKTFNATQIPNLKAWYDGSNISTLTKAYQNLVATATGTSGTTSITASADMTGKIQVGEKLRVKGTDIYTVATVSTVTITTVETLSQNYVVDVMALDRVSQWNDLSGQGNHATQATALTQPVYNPAIVNGKSVLAFDGANTLVLPSGLYTIPNGNNTLFAVANRLTSAGADSRVINMAIAGGNRWKIGYNDSDTAGNISYNSSTSATNSIIKGSQTTTSPQIITGFRNGTTLSISINNGTASTNTNGADQAGIDGGFIGAGATGTTLRLTGTIAEIIVFSRALSSSEIAIVNRYLSQKWAITIS